MPPAPDIARKSSSGRVRFPRPVRRVFNLLRRFSTLSFFFGELPAEPAVKRFYHEYITSDDIVIEVGARMGDGTRVLAHLAKHVYAFEPVRQSFLLLKMFTRKCDNVDAYNLATSDHTGKEYLEKDRSFTGVASFKKLAGVNYATSEKVNVARLDNLRFRLPPTSMVIDCEGSESQVLRGARTLLPSLRIVLVETHTLEDGSSTTDTVVSELKKYFSNIIVDQAGNERWVIASK